jgi:hypothetical protein
MTEKPYFILSQGEHYVQRVGARAKLTVEYKSEVHYRLGLEILDKSPSLINFSSGSIKINTNEQLRLIHAIEIFRTFFECGKPLNKYLLRELNENYS